MGERHRAFDWSGSPIGPPGTWDNALKTLVPIMLASNQPMFVVWGPSRTLLYNDAYCHILGDKHPGALGRDFLEVWHEIRADLEPLVAGAYAGEPFQMDDIQLWLERRGYREEAHFSFFYSPVRGDSSDVAGFFCACNETTAQIMAERKLAEREARHRGVLENMDEGFTLFDRDFTIIEVNAAATRIVGLPREELVGRNHWERFPGSRDGVLGQMYFAAMVDRRPRIFEHHYTYPDGRGYWYDVRAFAVEEGLAVLFRDITERKRLQAEAAASFERVQLALEAGAIVGTWVWDIQADVFFGDERFALAFGLDPAAVAAGVPLQHAIDVIHPADVPRVVAAIGHAVEHRTQYRCQYRVLRDGDYRWVEASGRVEVDAQGRAARFPGVLLDVDDRRRVEAERDQASALLSTLIEAVPGVVYAKDREGRFLMGNRGTAELLGRPPEAFLGLTDAEVLSDPVQAAAIMALDRDVMDSGRPRQAEEPVMKADGSPAIWWSTKEPLRDASGRVVGLVGTSVDITERKQMVEALREADRRKDEFLAMLAHELRNPLAPIGTAAALLRAPGVAPAMVQRASEIIGRQVGHITDLVDDLLDVSRVTRGLVELERTTFDLRDAARAAIEQVRPLLEQRGHALATGLGAAPTWVHADVTRITQVIANLLNNAAKYTPPGGRVGLDITSEGGRAHVRVSDNGIGIPAELMPHVFELFTQAQRSPDRTQGGLGIGLALVRSLVDMHGGSIVAESAGPGAGSTFTLVLPEADTPQPDRAADLDPPIHPATSLDVVIVDDNDDAAETLADLLRSLGHSVRTYPAAEALLADVGPPDPQGHHPDPGLPGLPGYELARHLRAQRRAARPVLIALSGYGQAQDRVQSREAGFDHHFVKPLPPDVLVQQMAEIARGAAIAGRA